MTVPFIVAGLLIAWFVAMVFVVAWLRGIALANQRYDQALQDYRDCPDELEDPAS